jgi:voltage-gated sodium channel
LKAHKLCGNDNFNRVITATIVLAGVLVGIETETEETPKHVVNVLDHIVLAIFSIEIIVKVMAEGDEPLRFFNDRWNCFDVVIVGGCFLFMIPFLPKIGSMLAMLRLLRLLRVLKLVKSMPKVI